MRSLPERNCVGRDSELLCQQAIESFGEAVALRPDHGGAYNNWGAVLNWMGAYDQAIDKFKSAFAVDPEAVSDMICGNIETALRGQATMGAIGLDEFIKAMTGMKERKRKVFEDSSLGARCIGG